MSVFAAVLTGKGTGAIATIGVVGDKARAILKRIFKPAGTKSIKFKAGQIYLGTIHKDHETIDQVTIGCESPTSYTINCHGNPLIIADIMQLLAQHGVKLLTAEQLLTKILSAQKPTTTIALEAMLTQLKARTIEGTKIITNQIHSGLSKKAVEWLKNINAISIKEIKVHTHRILENSQIAKLLIAGATIVLAGPPNTGKSTLLNFLAGRQKAIVTDIKGTTRDWVSARCRIGPLSVELIDTAGLDETLDATPENTIEKACQQKAIQILETADIILLVLDNNQPGDQLDSRLLKKISDKKLLTVLNKSDLPPRLDTSKLPPILASTVQISAKFGIGIERLLEKICQLAGVTNFNLQQPVCFTSRQENLLKQLKKAKSKKQAASIIIELLNGPV